MKKLEFRLKDILLGTVFMAVLLLISFGFGYFNGRIEQIELNKKPLIEYPDLNKCLG